MNSPRPPEPPPEGATVLTRDPVRIVWVVYGLVQTVLLLFVATGLVDERWTSIITGIALACYVAVSELYVRKETVPRRPLEELARAEREENP